MARGTGMTTRQMKEAPNGALFIWCNDRLAYAKDLARHLSRDDLDIRGPMSIDRHELRGRRWPAIVVDHYARLSQSQAEGLERLYAYLNCFQNEVHSEPHLRAVLEARL